MKKTIIAIPVLMLFLFGSGAFADEVQLPFVAILHGTADIQPTDDPCIFTNSETGGGLATHMGRVIAPSEEIINFCINPDGGIVNAEMIIVAANGDELFVVYETLAKINPGSTEITFIGPYQITGGTGRFTNASGEGIIEGQGILLPPFDVSAALTGKISY